MAITPARPDAPRDIWCEEGRQQVNCFVCNYTATASFAPSFRSPSFRSPLFRQCWSRLGWFRSLAMLVALTMSLFISAEGADARLKSEWKFGGSLARFMSLPFSTTVLGNDMIGESFSGGGATGDVTDT